jgi:Tfp pilus assembly protein PilX
MMRSFRRSSRLSCRSSVRHDSCRRREGTVLIICVVCVLLLSLTAGVLMRAAMLHREQTRTLVPQSQAEWLAHAAAQLAADRLKADAAWKGETWTVPAEETGLNEPARIAIAVANKSDRPDARLASITVDMPPDSPQRVRVTRSVEINIQTGGQ